MISSPGVAGGVLYPERRSGWMGAGGGGVLWVTVREFLISYSFNVV